jgi:hypothetical protein
MSRRRRAFLIGRAAVLAEMQAGHPLVCMLSGDGPIFALDGGSAVDRRVATSVITRNDVRSAHDALFPRYATADIRHHRHKVMAVMTP